MTWRPLLVGDQRDVALERAREIARDLAPRVLAHDFPGIAGGLAGFALFFQYADAAFPGEGHDELAVAILERTLELTSRGDLQLGLYGGYTGIGWVCDHLGASDGDDDPNQPIDALVLEALDAPWTGQLDLINGLVGLGVYALERGERGRGRDILARVVARLTELATPHRDGVTWHTAPQLLVPWQREAYPNGYYNLGLAHGIPGIVTLLARAGQVADAHVVDGAARWLAGVAQRGGDARYASCWSDDQAVEPPTRSAWCYGDPGVAAAFVGAGVARERPAWVELGLDIARGIARRSRTGAGCIDASLCHGTGGLAHILNRLYQVTDDAEVGAAARSWFADTLAIRVAGGVGGFREAPPTGDIAGWEETAGFLTGASGVGLALLAAATEAPPEWDRVMLIDLAQ